MECSKWDEIGLLFTSGELDQFQSTEFTKHLAACQSCNSELSQYTLERKQFFTPAILCEQTSGHVDAKILSLCSRPMVPTGMGLFSLAWVKRAAFSALVFTLGLTAGGYFAFAYYHTKTSAAFARATKNSPVPQTAPSAVASSAPAGDAAKPTIDTLKQTIPPLLKQGKRAHQTASPSQGIITVDLKKE
jgi:anti-sigma factor RsiW